MSLLQRSSEKLHRALAACVQALLKPITKADHFFWFETGHLKGAKEPEGAATLHSTCGGTVASARSHAGLLLTLINACQSLMLLWLGAPRAAFIEVYRPCSKPLRGCIMWLW